MTYIKILSMSVLGYAFMQSPVWAQQDGEIPVHDLGQREIGQKYPLKLTAKNINCEQPQDFEFEIDNMPWLNTPGDPIVRGLGTGQSKTIPSQMDFQYTSPGVHWGRITSHCISCGWFIFATCEDHGQDIIMKVTVIDPGSDQPPQNSRNPYAGMQPYIPVVLAAVEPLSDDTVRDHLERGQREDLKDARNAVAQAELNGKRARDKLRLAQKKKSDCERILARLKAEQDAADRKADTAKQDKKNADGAAKKAAKDLKDFEKDKKKALKEIDATGRAVIVGVKYRNSVESEDGVGGGRHTRAQEQVDRFQDAHNAALKEHSAVVKSHEAQKAQAEKSKKDADDAKRDADAADAAAKEAKRKYENQVKICAGDADAVDDAQDAVDDAKKDAKDAVKKGNDAEVKAAGQAADNLKDKIKKKENACKDMQKRQQQEIKELKDAIAAGVKAKMLDDKGGKKSSDKLKEVNDKIWDEARDMIQDNTILTVNDKGERGIGNDDSADIVSKDTVEDLADRVIAGLGWVAQGTADFLGSGGGAPDVGQSQMLGGLKALGFAVQGQVNALRNPNTYAAQRSIALQDEPYMHGELKKHGAKDPKKAYDIITKIHNNPNYESDMVQRHLKQAAKCIEALKKLKAQQAAAKKKSKQ